MWSLEGKGGILVKGKDNLGTINVIVEEYDGRWISPEQGCPHIGIWQGKKRVGQSDLFQTGFFLDILRH